jgi:hypothetical protein
MSIDQQLQSLVSGLIDNLKQDVEKEISKRLATINLNIMVEEIVSNQIKSIIQLQNFPERSISHQSVKFDGFAMTGDNIKGGIIEQFGSTGIEDRATHVQMTIMDHAVAFEGPLFAPTADIKGTLTVDGDLIVKGNVPTDSPLFTNIIDHSAVRVREILNEELFSGYTNLIYNKIAAEGVDLDRITQGGKEIVKGNQLGYHITDTNIQRVGIVRDFQTAGENLLSDTLYVSNRRIGVNTIDPSAVLTVWDEEVEVAISKRKQDVGYVSTPRRQQLILGSNNKENLILDVDGSVQINNLVVGRTAFTSAAAIPNYESDRGHIVYNEVPDLGSPIGWVCLGGSRWAKFGKIE